MKQTIYRCMLLLAIFVSAHAQSSKAVETFDNPDGTQRVRIYLNYNDAYKVSKRLAGSDAKLNIDLPIPEKWELLEVSGYIKYTSSLLMLENHSSGTVLLNDMVIDQFKLFEHAGVGVKFKIDPLLFDAYNRLTFQAIQHYTLKCEDSESNQLWTDIDLKESYVDFLVRPKPVREEMVSLKTVLFDQKQYAITPLNYVMHDKGNKRLKEYALFTAVASTQLKYETEEIKVSFKLNRDTHNVIIAPKERAREMLKVLDEFYLFEENPALSLHFNKGECSRDPGEGADRISCSQKGFVVMAHEDHSGEYGHFSGGQVTLPKRHLSKMSSEGAVAFWMRSDLQEGEQFLFGSDGYALMLSGSAIGFVDESGSRLEANLSLQDGAWHHVTALFSDDGISNNQLYVDGKKLQLSKDRGIARPSGIQRESSFAIGGRGSGQDDTFHGDMDQFYFFDRKLSRSSIERLYNASLYHRTHHMSGVLFIDEKISHDINIIQNPHHAENAIVVIAPEGEEKIASCVTALYRDDLLLYTRSGLDVVDTTLPSPALPYTAKKFLPLNEKIYFKELGYRTKLLKGRYPPSIALDFKVYPDNYFDSKDKVRLNLHYIFPNVVHPDSVANIYINDNFAHQIDLQSDAKNSELKVDASRLFDWDSLLGVPAYLVGQGFNRLRFDFSLVPIKKNSCEIFNTDNLVATVLDDSYFIIPKAERWIEMPYMQLIANAAYPYSIYPDLQDTAILLANKNLPTIAASMNFIFYLTQQIDSYPYHLKIADRLDEEAKASHIIAFGVIDDPLMQELSQDAPVTLNETTLTKHYPFIEKFVAHKSILDKSRNSKYRFENRVEESKSLDSNLILQMTRSPYNAKKTVLMAMAKRADYLDKGISSLLQQRNRGKIKGDLLIYDHHSEVGSSFDVKDKYILSDLNWIETFSLTVGSNPALYMVAIFFILLFITYMVRRFLMKFKDQHHGDAEEEHTKDAA